MRYYHSAVDAYHVGSFTSRAALKGYVRESSSLFHAARLLQTVAALPVDTGPTNPLYALERALGIVSHHDGVAGTSKAEVAYDYAKRVAIGRADAVQKLLSPVLSSLTRFTPSTPFVTCDLSNATICPSLEGPGGNTSSSVVMLLFNGQVSASLMWCVKDLLHSTVL